MRLGTKVRVIGKHRFLKSDVEYTVSGVDGEYVALEGLDYGCAWHMFNFKVVLENKFKVGDRVDFTHPSGVKHTNLEVVDTNISHCTLKVMYPDGTTGWYSDSRFKPHVPCKFARGDRVDFINPNAVRGLPTTDLRVIDINRNLVKIEWPDGRSGWWCEGSFKPHVSMKFKMGDRVDFIDPKVIQGHSATNLEVVGFDIARRAVNIKWPDGMSAWWSESYLKLHEPYKVGDLVDIISPTAKVWHGEFSKNLPICDITSGGTIVVRGVDSKLTGWYKCEVQASQGVGFKISDLVDTSDGDKNLYVADIHDNNTVKVRYPNGSYGQLHISQCVLSKVEHKVRVFHYPPTNVMYYVMLDGNVFAQGPLLKSDFTLDSLLKLDGMVEVKE